MRAKYGLEPDLTTILVSAGGFGVGPIEASDGVCSRPRAPGAGRGDLRAEREAAKARLDAQASGLPADARVTLHPVGFTEAMDEYMAASDLLLGKAGGLTTSEALARGLAFVIVNPIPGQEERNSDHLLEEGVAIRCNNLPALAYKVDRLLDDPARFAAMRANALGWPVRTPRRNVVNRLLELHRGNR